MNQQAPWWIPPPAQLSQPLVSCEARAAEQLHPPVQTPSLCSLTLISIFLAFFHVPAHKMMKEPPTNPSFSSPSLVHPFSKGLATAVWSVAQKSFWFQKWRVKVRCSYFTLSPPPPLCWAAAIVSFHFLKSLWAVSTHWKQKGRHSDVRAVIFTSSKLPKPFHMSHWTERGEALGRKKFATDPDESFTAPQSLCLPWYFLVVRIPSAENK